jgi:hypothetical protein
MYTMKGERERERMKKKFEIHAQKNAERKITYREENDSQKVPCDGILLEPI